MDHLSSLKSDQAMTYKKESAGRFAAFVEHFADMSKRLKSNSNVLAIGGSHGGTMEWLLYEALEWTDKTGNKRTGFDHISDIGGGFNPSEAYNVIVKTDEKGIIMPKLEVSFDGPNRPEGKMYLDIKKVVELSDFYNKLHTTHSVQ